MIKVVDYQTGNIRSVEKAINGLGRPCEMIHSYKDLENVSHIIFPGVGHFGWAMEKLKSLDLIPALEEAILERRIPVLGICLGMQLMCKSSEEGDAEGLGWIDATVQRFQPQDTLRYKVPHTGWNTIERQKSSALLHEIPERVEMYFVHSYYVDCDRKEDVLTQTNYATNFVSAFERENLFGVQFHPEKSHQLGFTLLKNFIST